MQASGAAPPAPPASADVKAPPPPDMRGKHRISAELKRLDHEARFLEMYYWQLPDDLLHGHVSEDSPQEELEELEKTQKVSTALQELLYKVESKPDPLLPLTNGPALPSWDQWFEGPQDLHGCRCWML